MAEQVTARALKKVGLFQGMTSAELAKVAKLCKEHAYNDGDLSVKQGETLSFINIVNKGRMGVETQLPSAPRDRNCIIVDTLGVGEVFPWAALMHKPASASVRAMESTRTLKLGVEELLALCEEDSHIGYIVMKNLSNLIASRLTRHRLALLSAVSGIGDGW